MLKEASKMFDVIIEFCRNNLDTLMIGGAVLIVFVILISLVKNSKDTDDEDLDFEEIFNPKKAEEPKAEPEEPIVEEESEALEEPMAEDEPEEEQVAEKRVEPVTQAKNMGYIETLLGDLSGVSKENLKKAEIKIQGVEVRLIYGDDQIEEIVKTVDEKVLLTENEDACDGQAVELESLEQNEKETGEETQAKTIKKFGPNNNNTTRSGRVYSEEELEEKIKD